MKQLFLGWVKGRYAVVIGRDISFYNDGYDVEYWHWRVFWFLKKLSRSAPSKPITIPKTGEVTPEDLLGGKNEVGQ